MPSIFDYQRQGGGSPGGYYGGGGGKKKKDDSFWDDVLETLTFASSIGGGLLGEHGPDPVSRTFGRVASVISSAPLAVATNPARAIEQGWETVRGLAELGPAMYSGIRKEGWWDTLDLMWEGIKSDYKHRYGENWREAMNEDPLSNLFDALTVFGLAARGASLAGAAGRLGKTGKTLGGSVNPLRTNIWRESAQPGVLTRKEGPWMRELRYQPETGPESFALQTYSRSPLRRGSQMLADYISEQLSDVPIAGSVAGTAARIQRTNAKTLSRTMDRLLGQPKNVDAIEKLPEAGRTRLYWGAQLGDHSTRALQRLRNVLDEEFAQGIKAADEAEDAELPQILRYAKQQGFGKELLKRLDEAIKYKPDERYERAVQAMRELSDVSEKVIADANGFSSLETDLIRAQARLERLAPGSEEHAKEAANVAKLENDLTAKAEDLGNMFRGRRRLVADFVNLRHHVSTPERQAWLDNLTERFGREQAEGLIAFADGIANRKRNPAGFWRDRIGMPDEEEAEDFLARVGEEGLYQRFSPYGETQLIVADPDTPFYSPLQRWIADEWPKGGRGKVPPRELRGRLTKQLSPEEYKITNLDEFFDKHSQNFGNQPITQDELQQHLASPMNSYNLVEFHFTNSDQARAAGFETRWERPDLMSRDPRAPGEYHELVYQATPGPFDPYEGKGMAHWNKENITFHIRFQVFMENGKTKLLIEEIQSDWAADVRSQASQVAHRQAWEERIAQLDPDERAALSALDDEARQLDDEWSNLADDLDRWEREHPDLEPEDGPAEIQEAQRRFDEIMDREQEMTEEAFDITGMEEPWEGGRILPDAPWGSSRYLGTAARRIMRYAEENGVDEIVVTDPSVQLFRNSNKIFANIPEPHFWRMTPDEIRDKLDQTPSPKWNDLYGRRMKKIFDRELGEAGEVVDDAYIGRYSGGAYFSESIDGDMRGLRYRVTPDVIERAKAPQAIFQRQPDWKKLPRGATELLQGGGSRIHLFRDANVSTFIHEMGHVAMHDLDEADQALLMGHYASGKEFAAWKASEHENFARDWERWVREGVAPTNALYQVFQRLSQWMKSVLGRIEGEEPGVLPDEIKRVFEDMFRGEGEPDIYIPHRSYDPNLSGGRTSRGIPRAGREIGDRTFPRQPIFKRNKLALLRTGIINDDPRLLIEHTHKMVMLARANQLREAVLEMGRPLSPTEMPDFQTQYVVKRAGSGVDKPTYDALEKADNADEIRTTIQQFVDDNITDDARKWEAWKGEAQLYVVDKRIVDMLFKNVTGKTPGATTKPTGTAGLVIDALLDSVRGMLLYANPGFYASNMVGNTWMMMASDPRAAKYLPWSMKNASKAAKGVRGEDTADPTWERISIEMGRGPTAGGLSYQPEFVGQGPNRSTRISRRATAGTSYAMHRWGRHAGRVIDDSFRVAAWRTVAAKHGYESLTDIKKLLDDASSQRRGMMRLDSKEKRELASIRDEAENLMLDFDSMTPFERTWLQRLIFLYPFVRASAKYPIMYAGERPITAGLTGQAGLWATPLADEYLGERPLLPAWAQGYARGFGGMMNVGSFSPYAMPLDLIESLKGIGQPTEIGVNRPYSFINPVYQLAISLARSQNRYGRDAPWPSILQSDFPAPSYISHALWNRQPSEVYTDRSKLDTLLRSLRVVPFGVEGE